MTDETKAARVAQVLSNEKLTITRYALPYDGELPLSLTVGTDILGVLMEVSVTPVLGVPSAMLALWTRGPTLHTATAYETRLFAVCPGWGGTSAASERHIGSVCDPHGLVYHVFEVLG